MPQMERPLFCIVADPSMARVARPDVSNYSPKGLAAKELVTVTTVYRWVRLGMPVMRKGRNGDITVNYQDYVNWMIDCARDPDTKANPPAWAYWCVRKYRGML